MDVNESSRLEIRDFEGSALNLEGVANHQYLRFSETLVLKTRLLVSGELTTLFRQTFYYWLNKRNERKSYSWKTFFIMWGQFLGDRQSRLINQGFQLSFIKDLL
jgi:hypothetical protein